VISLPDPKKGERLVLVTDQHDAEVSRLLAYAKEIGTSELAAPRRIVRVHDIPVLGSGKTDYVAIQRMAETEVLTP
jgi:acyl-[acyl-carrier-protein]-phospholipid O-acyltransferase/long-chain-fatty-acid--[acyl-carrier-protein] ligase